MDIAHLVLWGARASRNSSGPGRLGWPVFVSPVEENRENDSDAADDDVEQEEEEEEEKTRKHILKKEEEEKTMRSTTWRRRWYSWVKNIQEIPSISQWDKSPFEPWAPSQEFWSSRVPTWAANPTSFVRAVWPWSWRRWVTRRPHWSHGGVDSMYKVLVPLVISFYIDISMSISLYHIISTSTSIPISVSISIWVSVSMYLCQQRSLHGIWVLNSFFFGSNPLVCCFS